MVKIRPNFASAFRYSSLTHYDNHMGSNCFGTLRIHREPLLFSQVFQPAYFRITLNLDLHSTLRPTVNPSGNITNDSCRYVGQQCFKFTLPKELVQNWSHHAQMTMRKSLSIWFSWYRVNISSSIWFAAIQITGDDKRFITESSNVQWRVVIHFPSSSVTQKCSLASSAGEIGQPDGIVSALYKRKMCACVHKIFILFSSATRLPACLLAGLKNHCWICVYLVFSIKKIIKIV